MNHIRIQFGLRALMGWVALAAVFCAILAAERKHPVWAASTIVWLLGVAVLYRAFGPWKAGFISGAALFAFCLALTGYRYYATGYLGTWHNQLLGIMVTLLMCFVYGYGTSTLLWGMAVVARRVEGAWRCPRDDDRTTDSHH
jgi:hypothetical protein